MGYTIASAQLPDCRPYDSEEDLWEALREGEIDYDNYLDLLDNFRLRPDSASVPVSDWEALPGSDAGYLVGPDTAIGLARAPAEPSPRSERMHWFWRGGYNGDLSNSSSADGHTTIRFRNTNLSGLADWRHDGTRGYWQRRLVAWRTRAVRVQMGNIEPRFGRGLVVGRRSRLIGTSTTNRAAGDWRQPSRSRFNGVCVSTEGPKLFAADIIVSDIRSTDLLEQMAAASISVGPKQVKVGLTGLVGVIRRRDSNGSYRERVTGIHILAGDDDRRLLAEFAATRMGATAKAAEVSWKLTDGRFHARAWTYSTGFTNPWGGGPGHSDTRSVTLDGIDAAFASRTAGERGFSLATSLVPRQRFLGGHVDTDWEWMSHRESSGDPLQHTWAIRGRWRCGILMLRPFAHGGIDSTQESRYGAGWIWDCGSSDYALSSRFEIGRHNAARVRYLRAGLGARYKLSNTVHLEPKLRWVDPDLSRPGDGYLYLYFTESLAPIGALRLETTLVWQRFEAPAASDKTEIRLRLFAEM